MFNLRLHTQIVDADARAAGRGRRDEDEDEELEEEAESVLSALDVVEVPPRIFTTLSPTADPLPLPQEGERHHLVLAGAGAHLIFLLLSWRQSEQSCATEEEEQNGKRGGQMVSSFTVLKRWAPHRRPVAAVCFQPLNAAENEHTKRLKLVAATAASGVLWIFGLITLVCVHSV